MNLEYLIIYKSYGTPIYSRCFGHFCGVLMHDNLILSSFLAALTAAGSSLEQETINFEGHDMQLQFTHEGDLSYLTVGETKLCFFYVKIDDYYIATGFPAKIFNLSIHQAIVDELLDSISLFIESEHKDTRWEVIDDKEFLLFENNLLKKAVYPWMKKYRSSHSCSLGKNCVLRLSIVEGEKKSIAESIRQGLENFRKKSMLTKMRMMMGGMLYRMKSI